MSEFQSRRERREAERRAQQAQWEADHGLSQATPEAERRGSLASDRPREEAAPVSAPQASQQRDMRAGDPSPAAARYFAGQSDADLDEDDQESSTPYAAPAPASRAVGSWRPDDAQGNNAQGAGWGSASSEASPELQDGGPQPAGYQAFTPAASTPQAPEAPGFPGQSPQTQGFQATDSRGFQVAAQPPAQTSASAQPPAQAPSPVASQAPDQVPSQNQAQTSGQVQDQAAAEDEPQTFASRAQWREYRRRQAEEAQQDSPHATGTALSGRPASQDDWGGTAPGGAPQPGIRVGGQAAMLGSGASSDPASLGGLGSVDEYDSPSGTAAPGQFSSPTSPRQADVYGERGSRPATPEPELSTDTASFSSIPEPERLHSSEQTRATEEPRAQSSAPDLTERRTRSRRKAPVIKPPSTAGVSIVTGSQPTTESAPVREDNDEWVDEEYVDESELKDPPVKPMTARSVSRQEEPLLVGRTSSRLPVIALTIAVALALAFGVGALIFLLG